jgi:hypothetical protein
MSPAPFDSSPLTKGGGMREHKIRTVLGVSIVVAILFAAGFHFRRGMTPVDPAAETAATAMEQIAPPGGTGVKKHFYPSGALKQVDHWEDYEVKRIDYYDLAGRRIYGGKQINGKGLVIFVNDNGATGRNSADK